MKKLLILGGSGFFGNSIVDYGINKKLIKHNIDEIYIISRSKTSKKKTYKHIKLTYITKNIINIKKIPKIDYVIYCLKSVSTKSSNTYFKHFLKHSDYGIPRLQTCKNNKALAGKADEINREFTAKTSGRSLNVCAQIIFILCRVDFFANHFCRVTKPALRAE